MSGNKRTGSSESAGYARPKKAELFCPTFVFNGMFTGEFCNYVGELNGTVRVGVCILEKLANRKPLAWGRVVIWPNRGRDVTNRLKRKVAGRDRLRKHVLMLFASINTLDFTAQSGSCCQRSYCLKDFPQRLALEFSQEFPCTLSTSRTDNP